MYAATYSIYPLNIGYFSHVGTITAKSETVHMAQRVYLML